MSDSEAYADALERAKQVVSKFSSSDDVQLNGSSIGVKRPAGDSNDYTGAEKRPFVKDAAAIAAEAAAKLSQKISGGPATSPTSQSFARLITSEISIPDRFVGLVIGRKGEQIIKLQSDSNCKVQIAPEGGHPERTVTLTGTQQQVQQAKSMINDLIERADKSSNNNSTAAKSYSSMYDSYQQNGPMTTIEIMIPGPKAGLVIGKSGERIKRLQEENGVKMVLIQESSAPTMQDKPLRISGETSRVEKVKAQVLEILQQATVSGFGDSSEVTRYAVPVEKAGLVIGKGGETIKEICRSSGAVVHLSKEPSPDTSIKIFNIRGNRNETEQAIRMISERAGIPITTPTTGAAMAGAWGQYGYQTDPWAASSVAAAAVAGAGMPAPGYNPYTGQPDYSAAWIEYYRRQGMHEYADMIQRQSQQPGGGAPVQAQNGPVAPMSHQAPQQAVAPPQQQQQQVAPMAPAAPAYGGVPGQPAGQQADYGQWQQWQQWQAYQQAYQQQQPAMGNPMPGGPGMQQSAGVPPSVPMGGQMQYQQPQY